MEPKYLRWLELYASWNIDDRVGVKCRDEKVADSLGLRFWDEKDDLYKCPHAYLGDGTYVMPAKSREFIKGEEYTFSKVLKGQGGKGMIP